jgi:4-amino-4-deoxy-L-arabinose transferase-like glycosyltransferase
VLVGLGFNIKMLQAFLVLPSFYALYMFGAPIVWWKRCTHLALATIVLLTVSLSWAIAVDLTPPEQRPFIGSSQDNTVLQLIIGHNGLKRLLPGGLQGLATHLRTPGLRPSTSRPIPSRVQRNWPAESAHGPLPPEGSSIRPGRETGDPGLLRLYSRQLAGQITWLLPLAALGSAVAAGRTRFHLPLARRHQTLLLWTVWLLTQVIFFSVANMFHRYYLAMMAPAIAALIGPGVMALWEEYRRPRWRKWLLPLALAGTALLEACILVEFPQWSRWLTPFVVGICLAAGAALTIAKLFHSSRTRLLTGALTSVAMFALLIAPTVWALFPVWYGGHAGLPFAGPDLLTEPRPAEPPVPELLIKYLIANRGTEDYLVAALNARTAAPIILATGQPVMALGGFTGGDPILTVDELENLVLAGTVRFFLISPQRGHQAPLMRWVAERGVPVAPQFSQTAPSGPRQPDSAPPSAPQLFDCRGYLAKPQLEPQE